MKVPWQKERSTGGETAVQLRSGGRSTFGRLESYVPLLDGETALYREVREAVPVVDAAICKLIRLTGGGRVACGNERAEQGLQRFLCEVPVGRGQRGINAFLDCYLDSLLTCGRAVGEIVPDAEGREIAAVLCHRVEQLALREGETALDVRFCGYDAAGGGGGGAHRAARVSGPTALYAAQPRSGAPLRRFDAALDAVLNGAAAENLRRDGKELGPLRQCALCGDL